MIEHKIWASCVFGCIAVVSICVCIAQYAPPDPSKTIPDLLNRCMNGSEARGSEFCNALVQIAKG